MTIVQAKSNPAELIETFNDDYICNTTNSPKDGSTYINTETDRYILKHRREQLGLTQQQTADAAHIQLRQYQRLENLEREMPSASMRIGLSICYALKLDPRRFVSN